MKKTFSFLTTVLILLAGLGLFPQAAGAQVLHGTYAGSTSHSLSIHADGTLWATGSNQNGQLGTGNTTDQTSWVPVGTATNWVQVGAGQAHSLGLRADGTLWAWGDNTYGQLGTGTTASSNVPVQVGTATYTQLAAGLNHTLALRANGTLWAWGHNYQGQLGNPTNTNTDTANPTPTQVGTTLYSQVGAGDQHSLALRADGSLWAWGNNSLGQLGNPATTGSSSASPTRVGTGRYTQAAGGGTHTLALRADGSLWAWGDNSLGQLGDGTTTSQSSPVQVGTARYTQLAAGQAHSLALRANGTLWTWGRNDDGQLGTGTTSASANATPAQVGTAAWAQVAAGRQHSLGLQANGTLWAWGQNTAGQLGNGGTASPAPSPAATGTALPTRSTAAGAGFGLAVKGDGTLWAWGDNQYGQLGDGTTSQRTRPVQVGTDADWVQVTAGTGHTLALKANGTLWAWGLNRYGQLASSVNNSQNVANPAITQIAGTYTQVVAGSAHSLALLDDGSLLAWGFNAYGQLADPSSSGFFAPNPAPHAVAGPYRQLAAGVNHSLAIAADGTLRAWGANDQGQLGNPANSGSGSPNDVPLTVSGTATYTQVVAGANHTLALAEGGTVYAWGSNSSGQLGSGTVTGSPRPTPASVVGTYTAIATGNTHSLARRADGTLWAWGDNTIGQLGRGNYASTNAPTQEATLGTGWTSMAASSGAAFSLARTASGLTLASTGQNGNGQLGDGSTSPANRFDRTVVLGTAAPLPVQLLSFEAQRTGPATVQLTWATAMEIDNAGFGIEKSSDGTSYVRLDFVAANRDVPAGQGYTYQDQAAAEAAYYRLAQTDHDGTVSYSPPQYVPADGSGAALQLVLVPNPARGAVRALGLPAGARLGVYNSLGQCVRPAAATLDVAGLPPGVYVVRASGPGPQPRPARLTVN